MKLALIVFALPAALWAQRDVGRVAPPGPLHLVAFGDFGTGKPSQREVAEAIARRNAEAPFGLGITMGDNFYQCGVRGVRDRKWGERWESMYSELGIRFYASLGNHDYGHPPIICLFHPARVQAEIDYTQLSDSWRMPARYYTYTAGPARFIAIDTEGWSEKQLAWIKQTLAEDAGEPGIAWTIVYGHHPMFTSGVHLNERRIGALRRELFPVLKAAGVDLYMAGHDHDLERLEEGSMDFLICGGGGAKLRGIHDRVPGSVFSGSEHAFLDLVITGHMLTAQFYDADLKPLETAPLLRVK